MRRIYVGELESKTGSLERKGDISHRELGNTVDTRIYSVYLVCKYVGHFCDGRVRGRGHVLSTLQEIVHKVFFNKSSVFYIKISKYEYSCIFNQT